MINSPPPGARTSPATARNRGPILAALRPLLPRTGLVLEVASGAGEHAIYFSAALPNLRWLPSDPNPQALASIAAWREDASLPNLLAPLRLDAGEPQSWPVHAADAVVAINMIHIAPWSAAEGLMRGAGRILGAGGVLFLYGPFVESDVPTAPSNIAFNLDLRRRDPTWGIRGLDEVTLLARRSGLERTERIPMPANNLALAFRKGRVEHHHSPPTRSRRAFSSSSA